MPLSLLLFYNNACFGSPWILSSARETAYAELASKGLFGIRHPSPRIALRLLFDPARGVFIFSPFLLWSIVGFFRWWRSGEKRADCLFLFFSSLGLFVLLSGYPNWGGGASLGSRYLLPALFLVAFPLTHALRTPLSRGLFLVATGYSLASHLLLTSTFPHLGMVRMARDFDVLLVPEPWMDRRESGFADGSAVLGGLFESPRPSWFFAFCGVARSSGRWVSAPMAKLSTGIALLALLGLGLPELSAQRSAGARLALRASLRPGSGSAGARERRGTGFDPGTEGSRRPLCRSRPGLAVRLAPPRRSVGGGLAVP